MKGLFIILTYTVLLISSQSVYSRDYDVNKWSEETIAGFSQVNIYVPSSESPNGSGHALTIVLHGCAQVPDDFKDANLDNMADKYGTIIAMPKVENEAEFGCWDYRRTKKSRDSGDYKLILALVDELINEKSLQIDPDQVYIAGLSSGGGFSMTMGCIAPDVFAGMASAAAPSIGSNHDDPSSVGISRKEVVEICKASATSHSSYFSTQTAIFLHGEDDPLVTPEYSELGAHSMKEVYGVQAVETVSKTGGKQVSNFDNRVILVIADDTGHAWAGGKGASGAFIEDTVDYGDIIGEFFTSSNLRVRKQ